LDHWPHPDLAHELRALFQPICFQNNVPYSHGRAQIIFTQLALLLSIRVAHDPLASNNRIHRVRVITIQEPFSRTRLRSTLGIIQRFARCESRFDLLFALPLANDKKNANHDQSGINAPNIPT
jgi:hypothetical protein